MFDTNEFLKTAAVKYNNVKAMVECKDGFKVSVQASAFHYSKPREDGAEYYSHVELGYPSMVPPDYILDFADDALNPCYTVYQFVPVELVNKMIDLHNQ